VSNTNEETQAILKSSFPCRLCKAVFTNPSELGKHLTDEHQLSTFIAQQEVAILQLYWKARQVEETYEGYWVQDSFIVTGEKRSG